MLNHSSVEIGPNNKYAYKMSNFAVRYNTSQRQLNTARRGFAFRVIRRFAFAAIRFAKKCEGRGWISWTVAIVNAAVAIAPRDPLIRIAAVEFALSCSEDRWAEALLFDDFDESIFAKRIHFYRLAKICLYLERVSDAIKYLRIRSYWTWNKVDLGRRVVSSNFPHLKRFVPGPLRNLCRYPVPASTFPLGFGR